MKFKLQATHDDGTVITHEFEEDVWYAALDNFVKFLRGNGYFVSDKSVGINLKALCMLRYIHSLLTLSLFR